jgi:hypothetical protein
LCFDWLPLERFLDIFLTSAPVELGTLKIITPTEGMGK